jgi:5-methylcytosine-specific restriction endonuclease McrA
MTDELSWNDIRQKVYERAKGCCEYCRTCEDNTGQTMQVDHIDPDGSDSLDNLCLACWNCNNHKRKATLVKDTASSDMVSLYHPRTQKWTDHFEWIEGATLIHGITSTGRATVARLRWGVGGYHPPKDDPRRTEP